MRLRSRRERASLCLSCVEEADESVRRYDRTVEERCDDNLIDPRRDGDDGERSAGSVANVWTSGR